METKAEVMDLAAIKRIYPPKEQDLKNNKGEIYARAVVSKDENDVIIYVEPMTTVAVTSEKPAQEVEEK